MHDSDCLARAFTLSLIGYTSTCEIAVRHSDWLYRLFFICENKAYRFLQMSFMEYNCRVTCNKYVYASVARKGNSQPFKMLAFLIRRVSPSSGVVGLNFILLNQPIIFNNYSTRARWI